MSSFGAEDAELLAKQEKEERKRKRKEHQEAVAAGLAAKVKKALPEGYVCKICGVKNLHAVYECPQNEKNNKADKAGISAASGTGKEVVEGASHELEQGKKKKTKTEKPVKKSKKSKKSSDSDSSGSDSDSGNDRDITDESNAAGRAAFLRQASEAGGAGAGNDNIDGGYISQAQKQVYMSGLPFDMTVGKLLALLKEHEVDSELKQPYGIHIVCFPDKPGKCKGVAFVTFNNLKAALACCTTLDGLDLPKADGTAGKTLRCEVNNRKQAQEWKPPDLSLVPKGIVYKPNNKLVSNNGEPKVKRCYRCGSTDHEPKDCHNDRMCYRCRSTDHISTECPLRKAPHSSSGSSSSSSTSMSGAPRAYSGYSDRNAAGGYGGGANAGAGAGTATRRPGGMQARPDSGAAINKATGKGMLPAAAGKKIVFED